MTPRSAPAWPAIDPLAAGGLPKLAGGRVAVFWARLDLPAPHLDALRALLADDERRRAERFAFELHRQRFVAARGQLRRLLGAYLGAPPQSVAFEYGPEGKPALGASDAPRVAFNLSHSEDRAVVAVALDRAVGVDVERIRPDRALAAIARRFFSPSEQAALAALPEAARGAAFFAIWTRKEAYIKARGGGLRIPLASFDVSPGQPARLLRVDGDAEAARRYAMRALDVGTEFASALVTDGPAEWDGFVLEGSG